MTQHPEKLTLWQRAARLIGTRSGNGDATHPQIPATLTRPEGGLLWIHAAGMSQALDLVGIIGALRRDWPGLAVLLTTRGSVDAAALARRLPSGVLHQMLPQMRPTSVEQFFDHWRPDVCLWADSPEAMPCIDEAHARMVPLVLLASGRVDVWRTRSVRRKLREFRAIFVGDPVEMAAVRAAGVESGRTHLAGRPQEDAMALPVDDAERGHLGHLLEGRPVWLAARIPREELNLVLRAHALAAKATHRLALILWPESSVPASTVASACRAAGLTWCESQKMEPGAAPVQVIIADPDQTEGLWYHLATVTFIGGSLAQNGGHSPLEAAALGSAVVHGPHVGPFTDLYLRLGDVAAADMVTDAEDLAKSISALIVPERAAAMAHAAWVVSSAGAEASDTIIDVLEPLLPDEAGA